MSVTDSKFIELIENSKTDNAALLTIINYFEPKLIGSLFQTQPEYREDLRQDLSIKLIKAIRQYDTNNVPGFWEMKSRISSEM